MHPETIQYTNDQNDKPLSKLGNILTLAEDSIILPPSDNLNLIRDDQLDALTQTP